MRGEDWKLLLISASKAGDWKLCINTLQFLRPFLEAYHPSRETRSNSDSLSRKYRKLARALTASVLCFEERGHSAWAVRTIDDWIEWSGRRPPKEAVLASIRILASLGRGTEVTSLIQQVLQVKASTSDRGEEAQHTYEEILYIGAITHLHNNGLYEDADELYLQAVTNQHLPFSVANPREQPGQRTMVRGGMSGKLRLGPGPGQAVSDSDSARKKSRLVTLRASRCQSKGICNACHNHLLRWQRPLQVPLLSVSLRVVW